MTRRTIATLTATAMAAGCVALSSDTAAAVTSPSTTEEQQNWTHDYWDIYGLVSEGSMWNPEAFLRLNDQAELARTRTQADVVEVVAPRDRAGEDIAVFVDPSLAGACGIEQPELAFAFDSASVPDDADQTLERLSQCLKEPPLDDAYLSITGHTDPIGDEEYNRELGLDRADAVGEALEGLGIDGARIDTYSMGEEMASSAPSEWAGERRVVIALDR